MEQGTSEAPQKSSGTIAETQPAPRFTPQDYGLLLALIAAFVILIISLAKRRGG
jgi:hypothetical protein